METTGMPRSRMEPTGLVWVLAAVLSLTTACGQGQEAVPIDSDDLGGVVTGPSGPEAGVWVIAETTDLPTKLVKIVVTDEEGRYLVPDLPQATYDVWVRGYGLVDSPKEQAMPGSGLNLTAVAAPDPHAAAQYFPAGYWFSLIQPPAKTEFPGTGPSGNGISPDIDNQAQWLRVLKTGSCLTCHQLGNKATREIPPELGDFDSTVAAWERRIQAGQAGGNMLAGIGQIGLGRTVAVLADWTDRIAAGELPPMPPRPQGQERNVVITEWDWADPKVYLHDLTSTDRRAPTVNANGPVFGSLENAADYLPVLDPMENTTSQVMLTVRDPETQPSTVQQVLQPSPYWGEEVLWSSKNNVHNPMMDHEGRVWITSSVRPPENPDFCLEGSSHPSAQAFPVERANRHLAMYDPATKELTHISTCFSTHHLMFAEDANNTLWTSGGGQVVGWLDTKMFLETGDEARSQGWTALIMDTNGNGKRDAYVEPDQPVDPTMDKRFGRAFYGVSPAPDGSIWGSVTGFPGAVVRLDPGADPSETALAEVYEPPLDSQGVPVEGFTPRGFDVDRDGVAWLAMSSGHLASFDRRKCTGPLNGPTATGQHCPEGWTFYPEPLPQLKGVDSPGSAEGSYYTWVDQFDTFGLGPNTPINTGNLSEGLLALNDEEWLVFRVPYPLGYYTKWVDGRVDDVNAGWKGKGLWTTVSTRAPFHMEGGQGTPSKVIKFQLRPDPLAR